MVHDVGRRTASARKTMRVSFMMCPFDVSELSGARALSIASK
jgi:hypothetical protein